MNSSKRSGKQWIIVQLSIAGEREDRVGVIIKSVRRILRVHDIDVFVPAISQDVRDDSETLFYMDGYIFVEYRDGVRYLKLHDTTFFSNVLCTPGTSKSSPRYHLLSDDDLEPLRSGLDSIKYSTLKVGDRVKVIKGHHKDVPGRITSVHEDNEHAQISVDLTSKKLLMSFPMTYLKKVEDDE